MEKEYNVTFRIKIGKNSDINAVVKQIIGNIIRDHSEPFVKTTIAFAGGNEFTIDLPIVEEVK